MNKNGTKNGASSGEHLEVDLRPELDEALLALDELTLDDPEEALSMFDTLPEAVQALPEFQLLLARAHQALGQLEAACDLLKALIEGPTPSADAHHLLGDVLEDLGDEAAANDQFLKTRALDLTTFEQEVGHAEFKAALPALVVELAKELPHESLLTNVLDIPSEDQVRTGLDPRAHADFDADKSCLTIYAANLFAECGDLDDPDELRTEVRMAIIRDIADVFELTDEQLDTLGVLEPEAPDEN